LNSESQALKQKQYPELIPAGKEGEDLVDTKLTSNRRYGECHKVFLNKVGIGFIVRQGEKWLGGTSSKKTISKDFRGRKQDDFNQAVRYIVSSRKQFLDAIFMQRSPEGIITEKITIKRLEGR